MKHFTFLLSLKFLNRSLLILTMILLIATPVAVNSILNAPNDYLQGISAKIMYIHVPSAWLAMSFYIAMAGSCVLYLIFEAPIYDFLAKAISLVGFTFAVITLITGAIWGKPTWGTYWVWDARLTSMLILAFLYLGYIALRGSFFNEVRAAKSSSILAVIGLLNIPVIKFSVNLWNTLHQPASVFRLDGATIHSSMLYPLMISFGAILVFATIIVLIRIKTGIYQKKYQRKCFS